MSLGAFLAECNRTGADPHCDHWGVRATCSICRKLAAGLPLELHEKQTVARLAFIAARPDLWLGSQAWASGWWVGCEGREERPESELRQPWQAEAYELGRAAGMAAR